MMPHKRKGHDGGTLIRSLSESSPNKANRLYRRVLTDVRVFPNKIPHFLFTMALFGITLPSQQSLPPAFWDFFCLCLLDRQMQDDLVTAKVINWCSSFTHLSILSTAPDGNCLLHALSQGMWGIQDRFLCLRRLLYSAMIEDNKNEKLFYKRWRAEKQKEFTGHSHSLNIQTQDWDLEWQSVVSSAEASVTSDNNYKYLEGIHIFVMANILRRPIVVHGEANICNMHGSIINTNSMQGIYLPLLWKSSDCAKGPLMLAYKNNHFAPLIPPELSSEKNSLINAVPLVKSETNTELLPLRFLSEHESSNSAQILTDYLDTIDNPVTSAKLSFQKLGPDLDLMRDYYQMIERLYQTERNISKMCTPKSKHHKQTSTSASAMNDQESCQQAVTSQLDKTCKSQNCDSSGAEEYLDYCYKCYKNHKKLKSHHVKTASRSAREKRHSTPGKLFIPGDEHGRNQYAGVGSGMNPAYSLMSGPCAHFNCSELVTSRTYPYCYEHRVEAPRSADAVVSPSQAQMESFLESPNPLSDLNIPSLDDISVAARKSLRCNITGCRLQARLEYKGMCTQHFLLQQAAEKKRRVSNSGIQMPSSSAEDVPACASHEHLELLQIGHGNILTCRRAGCCQPSDAHYEGNCSMCYIQEPLNFYPQDHLANIDNLQRLSVNSCESRIATSPEQCPEAVPIDVPSATRRPSICANHGCSGIPTMNPLFLCHYCFLDFENGVLPSNFTEETRVLPMTEVRFASIERAPSVVGSVYPSSDPSSIASVERHTMQRTPCIFPECNNDGHSFINGLCIECYNSLCDQVAARNARRITEASSSSQQYDTLQSAQQTSLSESEQYPRQSNSRCRNLQCRMYGHPRFDGYCSHCYPGRSHQVHRRAASTVEPLMQEHTHRRGDDVIGEPRTEHRPAEAVPRASCTGIATTGVRRQSSYHQAVADIEHSSRSAVAKCKAPRCGNYGNPAARGYCNSCSVRHRSSCTL